MVTLQQVHFKIRDLHRDRNSIPVDAILQAFNNEDIVTSHIEALRYIEMIEFDRFSPGEVKLTLNGELTNVPR